MTNKQRLGFSLVELLVVLAIVGVLIGILLPAVQQVREAARSTTCSSNLRQIALAILNYESAHQQYPSGFEHIDGKETNTFDDDLILHSTSLRIAPYAEYALVRDRIIESARLQDVQRVDLVDYDSEPVIPALPLNHCPSMAIPLRVTNHSIDIPIRIRTDYLPCNGFVEPETTRVVRGANFARRLADIRDGTSNTICFGESQGEVVAGVREYCLPYSFQPGRFINWATDASNGVNGIRVIPAPFLNPFDGKDGNLRYSSKQFSSPHRGVVPFAMCDGSVRFVNQDTNPSVLMAIASIDYRDLTNFQ